MRTVGIDLAAEPKGTAFSVIDWSPSGAELIQVKVGATDHDLVAISKLAQKVGIDCALGWPRDFVEFLQLQLSTDFEGQVIDGGLDWRRRLSFRETDRYVRKVTGRWPLSVATDRLGMTALRCSGLLSRMREAGLAADRSGAGDVVEIYPRATMQIWKLDFEGYRISPEVRARLLLDLKSRAPWLEFGNFKDILIQSCDAFDSFIAALATRAAALGFYEKPSELLQPLAQVEGWIALPNQGLEELLAK